VIAARPLVLILACSTLAACATQTIESGGPRSVRTSVGAGSATADAQTTHGYVEGELIIAFTPEGEKTVAPVVAQPPTKLRFGVLSLDRLNMKYRASQLVKLADVRGAYVLRIAPDANVFRAIEEYRKDPLVTGTDLHYLYRLPGAEAPNAVKTQIGPLRRNDRPTEPIPH
jgi:hypothetical protein